MQQLLWWTRLVGNLTLISLRTTAGIKRSSLSLVIAYQIEDLPAGYRTLLIGPTIDSHLDCHGAVNYHKPDREGIKSSFVHLSEILCSWPYAFNFGQPIWSPTSCAYKINQYVLKVCQFPVAWKEALVSLLLKKPGLDILFKSFCPVSNLPFVSKLTESAVYNQIKLIVTVAWTIFTLPNSVAESEKWRLVEHVQSACNTTGFIRS